MVSCLKHPFEESIVKKFIVALFAFALLALPVRALDLGDQAPAIEVDSWITGEPANPTAAPNGKTFYLVEVWSTTCPPCVRTIPLLNELQKKYADQGLKIVSFTSDTAEEVKKFLEEHPMEYSSFIDKDGATTVNYMAADNRNTIPHAFLFDRSGVLLWEGNPLDNLESRIKQLLDGTLTKEKAVAVRDARAKLQNAFEAQNVEDMLSSLKELEAIEPDNGQYYQVHYRILTELGVGNEGDVRDLLVAWYKGSHDQPESLAILSVLAMDQGAPAYRNPELALAAAKRAYAIDTESPKLQTGLNLAEAYKAIGRLDRSLEIVKELAKEVPPESMEILSSIQDFYTRLMDLAKNPDAEYKP